MNLTIKLTVCLIVLFINICFADTLPKQARIYDIGTYVSNLDKTEVFYTTVFNLKVVKRWDSMQMSLDAKTYKDVPLKGIYLQGSNGMHLEFLEKASIKNRQANQQPINHYALEVEDVASTLALALSMGAKPAFPNMPLQYIKIGDFSVLTTQIIGIDGERIQLLQQLTYK